MDKRHQRIHFHPAVPCQPGQTDESGLIPPPPVSSTFLLGKQGQLEIIHDGQLYRLRKTATGKLILTK